MIRITKEFKFEMAHALYGYDGLCKNIHGHSYRMWVTIKGKVLEKNNHTKNGMVIDFGDLKKIINNCIDLVIQLLNLANCNLSLQFLVHTLNHMTYFGLNVFLF